MFLGLSPSTCMSPAISHEMLMFRISPRSPFIKSYGSWLSRFSLCDVCERFRIATYRNISQHIATVNPKKADQCGIERGSGGVRVRDGCSFRAKDTFLTFYRFFTIRCLGRFCLSRNCTLAEARSLEYDPAAETYRSKCRLWCVMRSFRFWHRRSTAQTSQLRSLGCNLWRH